MIKYLYVLDGSQLVKFNKETEDITCLNNKSTNIDWMWIADEDGTFGDEEIKAGDIILRMYGIGKGNLRYSEREYFIIKDEKLKDYYKRLNEFNIERTKELEENLKCENCESCGDCCSDN